MIWLPFRAHTCSIPVPSAGSQGTALPTSSRGWTGTGRITVSSVTVTERIRGYSVLWHRSTPQLRPGIESARRAYLSNLADPGPWIQPLPLCPGRSWGCFPTLRHRPENLTVVPRLGMIVSRGGALIPSSPRRRWLSACRCFTTTASTSKRSPAQSRPIPSGFRV